MFCLSSHQLVENYFNGEHGIGIRSMFCWDSRNLTLSRTEMKYTELIETRQHSSMNCIMTFQYCDGVYQPCTNPARVNRALWTDEATPPRPCWACSDWRQSIKGCSLAQSGLMEEESRCMKQLLPRHCWSPRLQRPSILRPLRMPS